MSSAYARTPPGSESLTLSESIKLQVLSKTAAARSSFSPLVHIATDVSEY